MVLDGLSFVISECRRYEKMYVKERSNYWLSHHLVTHNYYLQETADSFKDPSTATPGARLYSEFCSQAPEANIHSSSSSSPWKSRFKLAMRCQNIEQFGLPSFISAYNGQPVLIRNTGVLIR